MWEISLKVKHYMTLFNGYYNRLTENNLLFWMEMPIANQSSCNNKVRNDYKNTSIKLGDLVHLPANVNSSATL